MYLRKLFITFILLINSVYLSADEESFIKDIYKSSFQREPSLEEISYWEKRLDQNLSTATSMLLSIYKSDEMKDFDLDNKEFIKRTYKIFFNRFSKEEGEHYWLNKLKNGYSREQIFYHFAMSKEFIDRSLKNFVVPFNENDKKRAFISRFYSLILFRDSDEEGMEYWFKHLNRPFDTVKIVKNFIFSDEMEKKSLKPKDFIKILYRVFFDREPDIEGFDFWLKALKEKGKEWVVSAMTESLEFKKLSEEIFKKEKFIFPKREYFKILKTAQTKSYTPFDDGYYQKGDDLNYSRDNEKGIVFDHTLSLMWQDNVKDGGEMLSFGEAKEYCENLELGGFNDWRLPTENELVNLEAFRYLPGWRYSLPKIFKNVDSWKFWSQDSFKGDDSRAWVVCYGQGFARVYPKSDDFHTRCVRGNIYKREFKRDDKKEIVEFGELIWQDNFEAKSVRLNFSEAINYCKNLKFGGFDDWRLPNAKELFMIGDREKIYPSIASAFKNFAHGFYWSSTTYQRFDDEGWRVDFNKGGMEHTKKNSLGYVRCVRDKK